MKVRLRSLIARLPERDLVPVTALLIGAVAVFAFLKLGSEIMEGETHALDLALLQALREPGRPHDPIGPHWLEQAAQDMTSLGSVAVLSFVLIGAAGYLVMMRKWRDALVLGFAVPGGLLISNALKALYGRPRPDLVPEAVAHLNASYPSGHAMMSAVTYLTLAALLARTQSNPQVKAYFYGLALTTTILVGLTRIYLGLHWPSDVLGGWCVGAAWAIFCRLLADYGPRLAPSRR